MKFLLSQRITLDIYHGNANWYETVSHGSDVFGDKLCPQGYKSSNERSFYALEENIEKIVNDNGFMNLDGGMLMMLNKRFDDLDFSDFDEDLLRENVDLYMMEDEMYDGLNEYINVSQQNLTKFIGDKCIHLHSINTEDYFNNLGMEGTVKFTKEKFFSSYVEKLRGGYKDPCYGKTMELFMDELKDFDIEVIYKTHCFEEEKDYVCYTQKLDITSGEEMDWFVEMYVENDMRMNWKTYDLRQPLNGNDVNIEINFTNKKR